ncbi:MAG: glycosyltransferase, partial [Pseudomonadota bacterium]
MGGERIAIIGGRIIDPDNGTDFIGNLYIAGGKILALEQGPEGFQADKEIKLAGQIVCPGFVDLSARVREPGKEHKATIESETAAAARSGITTLCCPPDTTPVTDTPAVAELIKEKAGIAGKARLLPIGALTQGLAGKDLSEMEALKNAGCVAVSNAFEPMINLLVLRRSMEYAASHGLLLIIRPEDPSLRNDGCAHEGAVATRYGLPGIPDTAETVAVSQTLALVEQTGIRAHFGQLSCARSVTLIAKAISDGMPVSADVAAHQLHLTESNLRDFDANYHVSPPLRTESDLQALRAGLADGVIAALCSDHQPHDENAKLAAFPCTEPGISALETLLPFALRLVDDGVVTLPRALARLTGRFPEASLVVIGEGSDRARLERLTADANLAERVRFTGFVP